MPILAKEAKKPNQFKQSSIVLFTLSLCTFCKPNSPPSISIQNHWFEFERGCHVIAANLATQKTIPQSTIANAANCSPHCSKHPLRRPVYVSELAQHHRSKQQQHRQLCCFSVVCWLFHGVFSSLGSSLFHFCHSIRSLHCRSDDTRVRHQQVSHAPRFPHEVPVRWCSFFSPLKSTMIIVSCEVASWRDSAWVQYARKNMCQWYTVLTYLNRATERMINYTGM